MKNLSRLPRFLTALVALSCLSGASLMANGPVLDPDSPLGPRFSEDFIVKAQLTNGPVLDPDSPLGPRVYAEGTAVMTVNENGTVIYRILAPTYDIPYNLFAEEDCDVDVYATPADRLCD